MVSVMVGLGETYVPAFVLALGLGQVAAGLVATLPLLLGSVLQLATPLLVRWCGSYRKWVVACASCQACSLLLMASLAWQPRWSPWLVFAAAAGYWAAGLGANPAWNAWVEHLVPRRVRASFFARRVRVGQLCVLLGLVAGGLLLRGVAPGIGLRTTFGLVFCLAAASRLISAIMLGRQSESARMGAHSLSGSHGRTLPWQTAGGRLVCYLVSLQVAVHVAGPYFTPFMLTKLQLSYLEYMLVLSAAFLGKIVALPWFGAYAKRAGATRLLWIGAVGVVPVASFWLISDSLPYLLIMQFGSGVVWAAHELAVLLLFFESIPSHERVAVLTWYNLGNSLAMALGALLGAIVLHTLGDGVSTYLTLFALSSLARGLTLMLLPGLPPREVPVAPLPVRVLAVRPSAGSIDRPILTTLTAPSPLRASTGNDEGDESVPARRAA